MNEAEKFVTDNLDKRDIYEQLAEEASELAQASLKYIRAFRMSKNPTPVTQMVAMRTLADEMIDVCMCAYLLHVLPSEAEIRNTGKWDRWVERIREDKALRKALGR